MEYIILIIIGYFFLRICWKLLRHILSPETATLWIITVGLMMAGLEWLGLLILGWKYILIPIGKYYEKRERRKRRRGSDDVSNETVMWLIPIFWPILIAKHLLRDKPRKEDMTPYDYEQFEKTNGK